MSEASSNNLIVWAKSLLPFIILAIGLVVNFTRSEFKIEKLEADYAIMLAVNATQATNINKNENDIIGMQKDISQIIKTQETMIESNNKNTTAIINAIGRVSNGS